MIPFLSLTDNKEKPKLLQLISLSQGKDSSVYQHLHKWERNSTSQCQCRDWETLSACRGGGWHWHDHRIVPLWRAQGLPCTHHSFQQPLKRAGSPVPSTSESTRCTDSESCICEPILVCNCETGSGSWSQLSLSLQEMHYEVCTRIITPPGRLQKALMNAGKSPESLQSILIPVIASLPSFIGFFKLMTESLWVWNLCHYLFKR